MSAGHGHRGALDTLHAPLATAVHAVDPAVKLVCLLGFVGAVVATPPRAVAAFGAHAVLLAVTAHLAGLPTRVLVRRLQIEVPFLAFAVALPFVGTAPHRALLGIEVSVPGAWAAWGIVAKATLGTAAAVVLAWSTPVPELLAGLERLRVPRALTAIAGFMARYAEVVTGELRRLRIARLSRGDDPRWIWQARAVAATAGALFVRTYERGERVRHAMVARGFTGSFPPTTPAPGRTRWFPALAWPLAAWAVAAAALLR